MEIVAEELAIFSARMLDLPMKMTDCPARMPDWTYEGGSILTFQLGIDKFTSKYRDLSNMLDTVQLTPTVRFPYFKDIHAKI